VSPTSSTGYSVTVTSSAGCVASSTGTVIVNPSPVVSAGSDVTIYAGQCVTLGGSPTASGGTSPYSYAWSPANGLDNATSANPVACIEITESYTVLVTDVNGCTRIAGGGAGAGSSGRVSVTPVPYYCTLTPKLDADFYSTIDGFLFFRIEGEYNTGALKYAVYDQDVKTYTTSSPAWALTPSVRKYGDNRFVLDLRCWLTTNHIYRLEVTNEKNEVVKLKFRLEPFTNTISCGPNPF
jgi:hypothetical protein